MFSKRGKFRNKRGTNYQRPSYQKRIYRHCEQLLEAEVGITEFINQLEGFSGVIKARFSDFQVHEINLQGEVAKLTDISIPKEFSQKIMKTDFREVQQSPNEYIPQEKWEAIKNVAQTPDSEPVLLDVEALSKETRKELHCCIKNHFGRKVVSSTVQKDGKPFVEVRKYNKDNPHDTQRQWPLGVDEYVHFIVYKEKLDTMEACMKIGSAMKMPPSKIDHAGTKDRRAITTQWFSIHKVEPWRLLAKTRKYPQMKFGNFTFKKEPLRLGQLKGNVFDIALRNVTATDENIAHSLNALKENGFINYFGLQRFGNDKEVPTFQVGIKLLQGKWKEAVQLILKPKASDDPGSPQADIVMAKKIYTETGDAKKAYEVAERNKASAVEFKLLEGLSKNNENDYVNALEKIPRSMRLLYLHSFQSFIWNKMVSMRLKLYGMKPVEGDLVFVTDLQEESSGESVLAAAKDEDSEVEANEGVKCKTEVKVLTATDISNYTVYDVVLPLPGYDVVYPENLKQYYKEALEEHELTLEMTKQKVRSYNLSGDYRKILGRAKDLSWKIMKYDDPTEDLIRSDFQELQGKPEPVSIEGGKYKALVLEFSLNSSSYATMVLREFLKCETSSFAHSQMNDYHEEKKHSKVVADSVDTNEGERNEGDVECEIAPSNSLLANPKKYEEFKNSIFNSITPSLKRPNAETEVEEASKKAKNDDEGIKTQASLI
nr:pseudouridylate synthase 7 homolog isoform X1 [Leptinotarsa decemlineata]